MDLLTRIRAGDPRAMEILFKRYLPIMRRFAHGRLPGHVRGWTSSDDVVSIGLGRALRHAHRFIPKHEFAFRYYVRVCVLREIAGAVRRAKRHPMHGDLTESIPDPGLSPLERVIGRDNAERFERAMRLLSRNDRIAVSMRLEFQAPFKEIGDALGVNEGAARMRFKRALHKLAVSMRDVR